MNHSQLRAFHAVASEGSFTKASAVLNVVQPTVSAHVKALEEHYGVTLFHRTSRKIEITEFGQRLLDITQRYFAVETQAKQLLTSATGLKVGRLRVGADSPYCIVPLLAQFTRKFPKVTKSVFLGNSGAVLENILSAKSDIGILPQVEQDERLHIVPYLQDRLVFFVAQDHTWSKRKRIRLHDLREQTVITRESGSTTRAVFEQTLAKHDIQLTDTFEMGSREAVREAVAAGMGVGFVGESEFGHDSRLHKLSVSGADLKVIEYAICRRDRKNDLAITEFLNIVASLAQL